MSAGPSATLDFSGVTEQPGDQVRPIALQMLVTRYAWARERAEGRELLEVACGPGQGLAYLATAARRVVGGDYTDALAHRARAEYDGRFAIVRLDAQHLPFGSGSFDVVLCCEALYYLPDPDAFVREARRVLRPGGRLLISTINCAWHGFNASPWSHRYHTAGDLRALFARHGFDVDLRAGFRDEPSGLRDLAVAVIRRAAAAARIIPKTMAGKRMLKRLFYGRLLPVPGRIGADLAPAAALFPIASGDDAAPYQVLYAEGRLTS